MHEMFFDRLFRKFILTKSNLSKKLCELMYFLRYDKKKKPNNKISDFDDYKDYKSLC